VPVLLLGRRGFIDARADARAVRCAAAAPGAGHRRPGRRALQLHGLPAPLRRENHRIDVVNIAARRFPIQVLKESDFVCEGGDPKPCDEYRVAQLNIESGAYEELLPSGYLTGWLGTSASINGVGMHEDSNGDNYMYAYQGGWLVRFDVSSSKDVANLPYGNFAATIVGDNYYFPKNGGGFGEFVPVLKSNCRGASHWFICTQRVGRLLRGQEHPYGGPRGQHDRTR
jgi:hypothetical protein